VDVASGLIFVDLEIDDISLPQSYASELFVFLLAEAVLELLLEEFNILAL
jgi:hypothetical protein